MRNFRVGQKVVCINDRGSPEFWNGCRLARKGKVYTVRSIFYWGEQSLLRLEEIVNPVFGYADGSEDEPGFEAEYFRPIVNRLTDISVFKAMLTPSKSKVPA
ncbi:hypothetical protein LZK73_18585 [Neorhizobium galegae]|nr:hypothetical protein LZK73_18585 [Neorhizobium galegae]